MLDTRFRLGSMNKMLTSVAILERAGKVSLDGTLGDYLTAYPNADMRRATVRQLLSHRAGAGDIFGPEFDRERERLRTHADYLALYGTRAPAHPPGSRYDEAERFFGQFKDLWLSLRPGNKVSMKEIRSVSGSHRPERFACLSLLDLWDDLLTFNHWLDNYATESSLSSPIVLMQRGLN